MPSWHTTHTSPSPGRARSCPDTKGSVSISRAVQPAPSPLVSGRGAFSDGWRAGATDALDAAPRRKRRAAAVALARRCRRLLEEDSGGGAPASAPASSPPAGTTAMAFSSAAPALGDATATAATSGAPRSVTTSAKADPPAGRRLVSARELAVSFAASLERMADATATRAFSAARIPSPSDVAAPVAHLSGVRPGDARATATS